MSCLKFTYGVMGSSKSAQALITRYNYIQKGFNVVLLKPDVDNRNDIGAKKISSRIGIYAECQNFHDQDNLIEIFNKYKDKEKSNILIIDECQFCTRDQIDQLKILSNTINVSCFGLKTNFKSELFEGSKRLIEIADEIKEISHICRCGNNAIINARFVNGKVTITGRELMIGGDECYEALCYNCWKELLDCK